MGIAQVQTPDQITLGKEFQEKPKKKLIKKAVVTEDPVEEYSKSNPHPKYKVIQNPFLPEKVKQMLQPEHHEWFQYGVGSNAVPDKTPE